jgi:hypothetical protein
MLLNRTSSKNGRKKHMSLIYCPECGHEISAAAVACPNCGRPIKAATPVVERKVVSNVVRDEPSFPKWAAIPLLVIGGLLILFIFLMLGRNDQSANDNLSVNVRTKPGEIARTENVTTTTVPSTSGQTVTIPNETSPGSVYVPPTSQQTIGGTQTGVASVPATDTKATVIINAKIAPRTGSPRAVRNEKFYLLDKDVETILTDAHVEPIEGQTLSNSLGLSILYPDRYGDFSRKALRAIKEHVKYAGTTDGSGKAQLGGILPDSYYLYGITKVGNGFAMWSSPVSITSGENLLNLSPASITEITQDSSGEE